MILGLWPYPGGGGGEGGGGARISGPPQILPNLRQMYISNVLIWARNPDGNPLQFSSNPLSFKKILLNSFLISFFKLIDKVIYTHITCSSRCMVYIDLQKVNNSMYMAIGRSQ